MDELVRHCLRELSFDGDLGCNVSRLHEFVNGFYSRSSSSPRQNIDDAYCAFIWSVIVQQPGVRVGTIPPGSATEVYIAPQTSAKRKAKAKGEELEDPLLPTTLDIIPDAMIRSLEDLTNEYGDGLRIAVNPEISFSAITGSHIRPSKLTPMVYTVLQFITRGREDGISVVDLGKKSGYDQKSCFYLVKQLLDLDLIVKKRRPGVSTNFCVHKYFFEHSPIWKKIVEEEMKANESEEEQDDDDTQMGPSSSDVEFSAIDSRHLSSLPLVRARIAKLLKNSPHHLHASQNLLLKIGFANPTKSDRRFFRSRIRDLIDQGVIEKVQVPHVHFPNRKVTCVHLIAPDEPPEGDKEIPLSGDAEHIVSGELEPTELKMNLTLHKQMINLLDVAGTTGMTLSELSNALCDFDRRTVELLLSRLEKDPPPLHLSDLGVAQLGETHGREKRYKYYTVAHYRTIATREKFEESRYLDVDCSSVGTFLPVDDKLFYKDEDTLNNYVDSFKRKSGLGGSDASSAKKSKKRKYVADARGGDESTHVTKGKKRKRADADVDVVNDSDAGEEPPLKRKRGGPQKKRPSVEGDGPGSQVGDQSDMPVPKKRGRPPKKSITATNLIHPSAETESSGQQGDVPQEMPVPKKRGRPPKKKSVAGAGQSGDLPNTVPKKRGRLPKAKPAESDADVAVTDDILMVDAAKPSTLDASSLQEPSALHLNDALPTADNDVSMQDGVSVHVTEAAGPSIAACENNSTGPLESRDSVSSNAVSTTPLRHSSRKPKPRHLSIERSPLREPSPSKGPGVRSQATLQEHPVDVDADDEAHQVEGDSLHGDPPAARAGLEIVTQHDHFLPPAASLVVSASVPTIEVPIDPRLTGEGGPLDAHTDVSRLISPNIPELTPSRQVQATNGESTLAVVGADAPNPMQDITSKRTHPDTSSPEPLAKRPRTNEPQTSSVTGFRSKANISQSRRESEILRVISDFGGIVNTSSKEFLEAHAAVVQAITKSGGVASTRPGARLDKRTVEATLKGLESRHKIKILTTSVKTPTGMYRLVRIIYFPDIPEEDLLAYLANFNVPQAAPEVIKTLDGPVAYGGESRRALRGFAPGITLSSHRTNANPLQDFQIQQLFGESDDTIRTALLTEKGTLAQAHGFIAGRAARARELHLSTVKLFEQGSPSPYIVSSEQRIIQMSYYFEELPIATYCQLVSCLTSSEDLVRVLNSESDRWTPVGQVSPDIQQTLEVARSRSRARLLDLLEILRYLRLAIPLQPSTSAQPLVTCTVNGQHPSAFDAVTADTWTPLSAPIYWQFTSEAPLYIWALSEDSPLFLKDMSVSTVEECSGFWRELQKLSIDDDYASSLAEIALPATTTNIGLARCLRRATSWTSGYNLSCNQSEYLRQFLNGANGYTPLEDEDGGEAHLDHLAWVISAPKDIVKQFFEKAHKKHVHELEKAQRRHRRAMNAKAKDTAAKAALASKAAEAKRQKEQDWDDMVNRIHPEPLKGPAATRVRRVRANFMQRSGTDHSKWEAEISEAIREASIAAKKVLPTSRPPIVSTVPRSGAVAPPVVVTDGPEKSIEDLLAQQGSLPVRQTSQKKKKGKDAVKGEPSADDTGRRTRFQWNRDFDELARDAFAVVRARCRNTGRLDLGAIVQVFPGVARNSVRQRIVHLKDSPGAEAYQARLEDKWYNLWVQHRGSETLPDKDPGSTTNFDLVAHIKFLRKHVDKNALRVGFVEQSSDVQIALPATVEQVETTWEVVDKRLPAPAWDFMWNVVAEEGREKQFAQQAFLTKMNEVPPVNDYPLEYTYVADSALKMMLGTPHESYDPEAAAKALHLVGEEYVKNATMNLLSRGILTKVVRDPKKSRPGRTLRISDNNQNALSGPLPQEVFQDASALEDLLAQEEDTGCWREWPLLVSDGDSAALLELVSEGKIDFQIDTTQARAARPKIDWNSKKADDDDIETAIQIRVNDNLSAAPRASPEFSVEPLVIQSNIQLETQPEAEHGKTAEGAEASCRLSSNGLVDCQACLDQAAKVLAEELSEENVEIMKQICMALKGAKTQGLTKEQLLANVESSSNASFLSVGRRMTEASIPLACWTGYKSIVLVSSDSLDPWTVSVSNSQDSRTKLFPRRWLDISGKKISDLWDAALRAIVAVILSRPGITQAEIRWRLRLVYDRQEVNEVLQYLLDDGVVTRRLLTSSPYQELGPPDDREEETISWFVVGSGEKHWFQM
ncbi:hypothetical protein BKA93DRAFT_741989 [Sparassis latifolia]